MSNYEERMSKKYNFFSNDKDVNDTSANEPEVSSETTSNMDTDEENMMVPISAWKKVLDQLGNLHEADKLMAEARERAAKAEAESEFLREKLKNTRDELNVFKKKKRFFFF
ncbi:hypothetical protein OBA39_01940 [Acidimicrobiaceae bacterium]|nr:hypothetical protein [Acidimicrobiaceae bacterium]|tara:strand:+ start:2806 stop:3138 length:333 start_codon:yes stop_codon:yes gene_type:complete